MGDIADEMLGRYMDDGGCWWRSRRALPPRCKLCGSGDVHWRDTDTGWRLYTKGKPHVCPKDPKKEFEDLDK